ncbi:hypothetical protein RhiirC2_790395 [Rhizophagus irregularis]|uniref:Uncharacterized protein n=1 Tax=Rhizophagus irregularis TaxID=588596 RepID=A0A2N1MLD3_9GLOM|nr:hypothetical protein RhiirC2_790395 [Rhizophagus irregularis]
MSSQKCNIIEIENDTNSINYDEYHDDNNKNNSAFDLLLISDNIRNQSTSKKVSRFPTSEKRLSLAVEVAETAKYF